MSTQKSMGWGCHSVGGMLAQHSQCPEFDSLALH